MKNKKSWMLLPAVLLCCAMLLPLLVNGAEEPLETDGPEYWFRQDFDELSAVNQSSDGDSVRAAGGLWVNTGFVPTLEEGALLLTGTKQQAFWDFQFWNTEHGQLTGNFVLSMRLKPAAEGLSYQQLVGFRRDTASSTHAYVSMSGGRVVIAGDDGSAESQILPTDGFTAVELLFVAEADGRYSRISLFVGGEYIGSRTLTDEALTSIAHFRNFLTYTEGSCYIDDLCVVKGAVSVCGTDFSPAGELPPADTGSGSDGTTDSPVSPIPTPDPDELVEMKYLYRENFDDLTEVNSSTATVAEANGFVALDNLNPVLKDGGLLLEDTVPSAFIDLQFFTVSDYPKVREDFILSFKLMPMSDSFRCDHLVDWRFYTAGTMESQRVSIRNSKLLVDGSEVGALPAGVYSLVEIVFRFNEEELLFDHFELLLNGERVAEFDAKSTENVRIDQFRLFRYRSGDMMLDDLIVAYGDTSMVYAAPDREPEESTDQGGEGSETPGENTGGTGDGSQETPTVSDTDAPEEPTASPDPTGGEQSSSPGDDPTDSSGTAAQGGCCSSLLAGGTAALILLIGGMAAVSVARRRT